jgi:hypothetical protein
LNQLRLPEGHLSINHQQQGIAVSRDDLAHEVPEAAACRARRR